MSTDGDIELDGPMPIGGSATDQGTYNSNQESGSSVRVGNWPH
jgi:hypothetical protein